MMYGLMSSKEPEETRSMLSPFFRMMHFAREYNLSEVDKPTESNYKLFYLEVYFAKPEYSAVK